MKEFPDRFDSRNEPELPPPYYFTKLLREKATYPRKIAELFGDRNLESEIRFIASPDEALILPSQLDQQLMFGRVIQEDARNFTVAAHNLDGTESMTKVTDSSYVVRFFPGAIVYVSDDRGFIKQTPRVITAINDDGTYEGWYLRPTGHKHDRRIIPDTTKTLLIGVVPRFLPQSFLTPPSRS